MSFLHDLFDCRRAVAHGSELVDRDVRGPGGWTLALHVRFCRNCRHHLQQLGTTVETLRRMPQPPGAVPPETKARILARLRPPKGPPGG